MRVIEKARLLAVLLAGAGTGAFAAPAAPATPGAGLPAEAWLLPQDAVVVVAADVKGFFASRLWQQVSSGQIGPAAGLTAEKSAELSRDVQEGMAKGMADMEAEVGFRADRDLDWVFFGLRNPTRRRPRAWPSWSAAWTPRASWPPPRPAGEERQHGVEEERGRRHGPVHREGRRPVSASAVQPAAHRGGRPPAGGAALVARAASRRPLEANTALAARLRGEAGGQRHLLASEAPRRRWARRVARARAQERPSVARRRHRAAAEMATAEDAQKGASTIQSRWHDRRHAGCGPTRRRAWRARCCRPLRARRRQGAARGHRARRLGLGRRPCYPQPVEGARRANESAAIGDLRTVGPAEAAYQSANKALRGDRVPQHARHLRQGYTGSSSTSSLVAGGEERLQARSTPASGARARSLQGYAYTAAPAEPARPARAFRGRGLGRHPRGSQGRRHQARGRRCPAALEVRSSARPPWYGLRE
jgi:hypothetical protein